MTRAAERSRVRSALPLAFALVAAGCGSYRRVAPLDSTERAEMQALGAALAGRRVIVPSAQCDAAEALGVLGVEAVPRGHSPPDGLAEIDGGARLGVCMNPMLGTILTFGVLPYTPPRGSTWEWRFVGADGRERGGTLELDDAATFGWLGLPLGLLPGRSVFFFSDPDKDDEQRAATRDRLAMFVARALAGVDQ